MPRYVLHSRANTLFRSHTRSRVPRLCAVLLPAISSPDRQADFFTRSPPSPSLQPSRPGLPQASKPDTVAGEQKVVTTELIQKYLNENEQLILAILENQNVGKLQECAQYQARLQQNLMYLAAIADATPKQ